ncbi:MAG TPA: heme ABC exporter ATP-binding protein CcmA [bacterium]|nr:heme ABC exporter ATP-binding protein CcmA [bacterium]HPN43427.1 heme ABC exporter ATP-binding protein CcmA [bacterium]
MIEAINIRKSFAGRCALHDVSFCVQRGEYAALLGVNGAGKTTLIRILSAMTRPASGDAVIDGVSLHKNANAVRSRIGVMSHTPFLYGDLSALENLRFYAGMYALRNCDSHIDELLHRVNLHGRRYDLVRTFSRGMQQRLSLARALLHQPSILLLDEPFTGLDIHAAQLLTDLLHQHIETGITVLLTTHDIDFSLQYADRIMILKNGMLAANESRATFSAKQIADLLDEAPQ